MIRNFVDFCGATRCACSYAESAAPSTSWRGSRAMPLDAMPAARAFVGDQPLASDALAIPLCVDLDQTLVRTDLLWEAVIQLASRPFVALRALAALLVGG